MILHGIIRASLSAEYARYTRKLQRIAHHNNSTIFIVKFYFFSIFVVVNDTPKYNLILALENDNDVDRFIEKLINTCFICAQK